MRHALESLMSPRSVAVLGASPREGALGNSVIQNLVNLKFPGEIYPVHPSGAKVCGISSHANLTSLPHQAECVVVCLSADKVTDALEEAHACGVRSAVIFASGFAETDEAGRRLQARLEAFASRTGMKICGPNCLGLVNLPARISLYSAALSANIPAGDVAIVSHSGSGCIVLSSTGRFGISHLVSVGNAAALDMAQYLDYLAYDDATRVAALFVESIRDPRAFESAARKMQSAGKPVVALKVGQSEKGAAATAAHTGSLAGAGKVYESFFRRCGVIAVQDLDELIETVVLLRSTTIKPVGNGVAVLNVSGGEVALTCDVAQRLGVNLPDLSEATKTRLRSILPSFGHAANPLDVTGVGVFDMTIYEGGVRALAADPAISFLAVSQDCPAGLGERQAENYRNIAKTVAAVAPTLEKPVVFYSNVAGGIHPRVSEPLIAAGVPVLQGARNSLLALKHAFELALPVGGSETGCRVSTIEKWTELLAIGRPLTERESKLFLADHGLPVTREDFAGSPEEAGKVAERLGYPVVMKIDSPDLPHKSDVGGVKLDLRSAENVAKAYGEMMETVSRLVPEARLNGVLIQEMVREGTEIIAGVTNNGPFGMALVVGAGGVLVELLQDSALELAPVSATGAKTMIGSTRVGRLLKGYRGAPAGDIEALSRVLAALSSVAVAYADLIEAIDLNPITVATEGKGVRIVDALIVPKKTSLSP
jgi:acetate---CoA ligase (ADP-forming)